MIRRRKPICGIYIITNKITGQIYIGQSVDCFRRFNEHCSRKRSAIDKAISKYGVENFNFSIIKRCKPSNLSYWENYYIFKFDSYHRGYNQKIDKKYYNRFVEKFSDR